MTFARAQQEDAEGGEEEDRRRGSYFYDVLPHNAQSAQMKTQLASLAVNLWLGGQYLCGRHMYIDSPKGCGRERKEVGPFVRQIVREERRKGRQQELFSRHATADSIEPNLTCISSPSLFPAQHHPLNLADLWRFEDS